MQRPPSIIRYEKLYLGALALGFANTALAWQQSIASFEANPVLAQMMWFLPASVIVGLAVRITIWYFTARRPSLAAKWAAVAMAGFSALVVLFGMFALISGAAPSFLGTVAGVLSGALYVVSASYLFRDDARRWFGQPDIIDEEDGA